MQYQFHFIKNMLFIAAVLIAFQSCNFKISTASINNVKLCNDIQESKLLCDADQPNFNRRSPAFFASCEVHYAPEDTNVTFSWYYLEEGRKKLIDAVTINTKSVKSSGSHYDMYSNLNAPTAGWPKGDYEIMITLDTDNSEPVTKQFAIQ